MDVHDMVAQAAKAAKEQAEKAAEQVEVLPAGFAPVQVVYEIVDATLSNEDGQTEQVKLIAMHTFSKLGEHVQFWPLDFAEWNANEIMNKVNEARSGLTVVRNGQVRELPGDGNGKA